MIKIFLSYLQVVVLVRNAPVSWPPAIASLFSAMTAATNIASKVGPTAMGRSSCEASASLVDGWMDTPPSYSLQGETHDKSKKSNSE